MKRPVSSISRTAYTLLETILAVVVVVTLMSLLLPAVQMTRERARLLTCQNNLMQIGVALSLYHETHRMLPSGCVNPEGPVWNNTRGPKISWIPQILPQLGYSGLWSRMNFDDPPRSFAQDNTEFAASGSQEMPTDQATTSLNSAEEAGFDPTALWRHVAQDISVPMLICPSRAWPGTNRSGRGPTASHYAGCYGGVATRIAADNDGLLYLNSSESLTDIADGASCTLLVAERLPGVLENGWIFGDHSTLRSTTYGLCPSLSVAVTAMTTDIIEQDVTSETQLGGPHLLTVQSLLADGSVRPLSRTIDREIYSSLGSRNDGALISVDKF